MHHIFDSLIFDMKFKISDESINSHGFTVNTDGIEHAESVVMLYNHDRNRPAIGRWNNIEKRDGAMFATPQFDEEDKFARKIQKKVDAAIITDCSVGLTVLEAKESDDGELTVTKSILKEVSICNVGANAQAKVQLFDKVGNEVQLSELSNFKEKNNGVIAKQKKESNMKSIANFLSLSDDSTEAESAGFFAHERERKNGIVGATNRREKRNCEAESRKRRRSSQRAH